MTPEDLQAKMKEPPNTIDIGILDRVQGSMVGLALGDALGAHVEFRPRKYLRHNPVRDLVGGGTWGLKKGQVKYLMLGQQCLNFDICMIEM